MTCSVRAPATILPFSPNDSIARRTPSASVSRYSACARVAPARRIIDWRLAVARRLVSFA
jgi:hypothetical protein